MRKKLPNYLILSLFIIYIFGFGIYSITKPSNKESFWENRVLAEKPNLSLATLQDGTFTEEFEYYFVDQFPLRNNFVFSYIKYQEILNQTFIQGYFIDNDNYAYPEPLNTLPKEELKLAINNTNDLALFTKEKGSEFVFFYMPNRIVVLHENYPPFLKGELRYQAKNYLYNGLEDSYLKFDMNDYFMNNYSNKRLKTYYYQTDHHWNADGAIIGYNYIIKKLEQSINGLNSNTIDYEKITEHDYSKKFLGSYNRQIFNLIKDHKDKTDYYQSTTLQENNMELYLGSVDSNNLVPISSLYQTELNKKSDTVTYSGTFINDYRELNFVYPSAKNDMKVLVIKDSYTNAISLLLAENFTQTTYYDVRHNQDRSLYDFIEQGKYDLVLFLNSDVSFSGNNFEFKGQQ